jgi:hypothetical protein
MTVSGDDIVILTDSWGSEGMSVYLTFHKTVQHDYIVFITII